MNKFNLFLENIGLRSTATGEKKPLGKIITSIAIIILVFIALIFGSKLLKTKEEVVLSEIKFELKGNTTMVLFLNKEYEEPGFIALDEYGKDISSKVSTIGSVDTTTPGIYEINYKLTLNKQTITKTRTITVVDETQTVFVLKGETNKTIKQGDNFTDEGYIVIIPGVSNPEKYVTVEGEVDTKTPGIYRITYKLEKDDIKEELVRTITVSSSSTESPLITLIGNQSISLRFGEKYTEQGYTAYDSKDGDITNKVTISSNLKTEIPGIYEVVYKVTNSRGITDVKTRIVRVLEQGENAFEVVGNFTDYVDITQTTTSITRGSITLNVKVINDKVNKIWLPDGSTTTAKNIKYNATENGTYIFVVETYDGTLVSGSIYVNNIDNEGPTGTCQAILKNNKVSYAVNASDEVSGISGYSYNKFDSFTEYIAENVYEFDLNTNSSKLDYSVIIKDKVGNSTKIKCTSEKLSTITNVKINGETRAKAKDTVILEAVITPEAAVNKKVTWEIIEGNRLGTIDQNGVVTITIDENASVSDKDYIIVQVTTDEGELTATHKIQLYKEEKVSSGDSGSSSGDSSSSSNLTAGLTNPNAIKLQVGEEIDMKLNDIESEQEVTSENTSIVSVNGTKIKGEKVGTTTIHIKTGETTHKSVVVSVIELTCGKSAQHMTQTYQIGNIVGDKIVYGKVNQVAYQGEIIIGKNQVLKVTVYLTQKCGETTYLTRTTADGEPGWTNYFKGFSDPYVNRNDPKTFLKGRTQYDWIIAPKTTTNRFIDLSQTSFQSTTVFSEIKSFGYVKVKVVEENVSIGLPGIQGNPGRPGFNA